MDFSDSAAEAEFRQEARDWLNNNVPSESELSGLDRVDRARFWQKRKSESGWACIGWPQQFGGRDATIMQQIIFAEEESRAGAPPAHHLGNGVGLGGPTLMACGTDLLREKYLPKIVTGEHVWCQLFSEPAAGSDLAGLRTRAERDGDGWRINGQKVWTSNAEDADVGMLVTRTDPNVAKHKGLTYFILDMKSEGIELRPIKQMNGEAEFCEVYLTDVYIPDDHRVGDVGQGWQVAMTTLMEERSSAMNEGGGLFLAVQDFIDLCSNLELDGSPAIENDEIRSRIADWYCTEAGLDYTVSRMMSALSRGKIPGPEASIGKLVAAPQTQEIANYALDLLEQAGPGLEHDKMAEAIEHFTASFMMAPGIRILGGTDEIMLNIIAEQVLGMPADIRADKGIPFCDIPTSL